MTHYDLEEYERNVISWSRSRGILTSSTPSQQFLKLVSEMGELADNIAKGRDIRDDVGDCLVVLTNIAALTHTSLNECFAVAWEDIKDRTGYLNEHGVFIKDAANDNTQMSLKYD